MKLYRVEIVEKDVIKDLPAGFRDVERVSSPAKTLEEAIQIANKMMLDFREELESEKYYIKVYYYTIKTEEKEGE